jgi:hypothetical protein
VPKEVTSQELFIERLAVASPQRAESANKIIAKIVRNALIICNHAFQPTGSRQF